MTSSAKPERRVSSEALRVAESFSTARMNGRALAAFPGVVPQNFALAYEVQDAGIDRWPDPVVGWKVARLGTTWQSAFPDERLIGPVFQRNIRMANGSKALPECPVFAGGFAAVEAEVVVIVAADAPPTKTEWTIDEAMAMVASMHIGIEIASSPLATLNDLGPGAVISDFGNNWGVVVGPAIAHWRTLSELAVETFIDGTSVGAAKVDIVKGPLGALVFTLRNAALRSRPLRAGAVISTGMITGVHDIGIGQRSRHVFDGCGEVGCRIVSATSYIAWE